VEGLIVIVVLLAALWLLLIRPQRRQQQRQQQMIQDVEVGDEIVTAGGLYGYVEEVADDEIKLEIAPGTTVRIAKRAIAGVTMEEVEEEVPEEAEAEPAEADAAAEEAEPTSSSGPARS
jgi:preprotein translocase subunit YajC